MTDIDFLPEEYVQLRLSRRDQWLAIGIAVLVAIILVGSALHQRAREASRQEHLASLEQDRADVEETLKELDQLEKQREELRGKANFYSLLRARPAFSRLLAAVAASCPARVTFTGLTVRSIKKPNSRIFSKTKGQAKPPITDPEELLKAELLERFRAERLDTQWELEIAGLAESDLEVFNLIDRLERTDCFQAVSLEKTNNAAGHGDLPLRSFTIRALVANILAE